MMLYNGAKKTFYLLILCINITKKTLFLAYKILIFDACQSLTAKYTTNYNYIHPCISNCFGLIKNRASTVAWGLTVLFFFISKEHLFFRLSGKPGRRDARGGGLGGPCPPPLPQFLMYQLILFQHYIISKLWLYFFF